MDVFNLKLLSCVASIGLLVTPILSHAGESAMLQQGGFNSINNETPTSNLLGPTYMGMMATYNKVLAYYEQHETLPPKDTYLLNFASGSALSFITNKKDGSIWAKFASNVGDLSSKNIRLIPPFESGRPNPNGPPLCISDVNYNNRGVSFLKNKLKNYTLSPTLIDSNFGKCFIAPPGPTININFTQLINNIKQANAGTTGGSTGGSNTGGTGDSTTASISTR